MKIKMILMKKIQFHKANMKVNFHNIHKYYFAGINFLKKQRKNRTNKTLKKIIILIIIFFFLQ